MRHFQEGILGEHFKRRKKKIAYYESQIIFKNPLQKASHIKMYVIHTSGLMCRVFAPTRDQKANRLNAREVSRVGILIHMWEKPVADESVRFTCGNIVSPHVKVLIPMSNFTSKIHKTRLNVCLVIIIKCRTCAVDLFKMTWAALGLLGSLYLLLLLPLSVGFLWILPSVIT